MHALILFALVAVQPGRPLTPLPAPQYLDGETAARTAADQNLPSRSGFGFDIDFTGSDSNNLEVALGTDRDKDGELSEAETDVTVGWDCGHYFIDRRDIRRRFDYRALDKRAERKLSYRVGTRKTRATTFDLQTDEGAFGRMVDTNRFPVTYTQDTDWLTEGSERTLTFRFVSGRGGGVNDLWRIYGLSVRRATPGTIPQGVTQDQQLADALGCPEFPCWTAGRGSWSRSDTSRGATIEVHPQGNNSFDISMQIKGPCELNYEWQICQGGFPNESAIRLLVGGVQIRQITKQSYDGGSICSFEGVSIKPDGSVPPPFVWSDQWDTLRVTSRGLPAAAQPGTYHIDQSGGLLMLR